MQYLAFNKKNKALEVFFAQGCVGGALAEGNLGQVIFWRRCFGIYWVFFLCETLLSKLHLFIGLILGGFMSLSVARRLS